MSVYSSVDGNKKLQNKTQKKIYLFLTASIVNVGGGQIYIRRKINYLKNNGFTPIVYSFSYGNCIIDDLKNFEPEIIPEIRYPISAYAHKISLGIKKKILSFIHSNYDSIIVESHEYVTSTWGESIAQDLNAKHIVYLLTETPWKIPLEWQSFLFMKYKRGELFLISSAIAKSFIAKFFNTNEDNPEKRTLRVKYGSVVENVSEARFGIRYEKDSITICSIGRLEKPFVYPMCCDLLAFIKEAPNFHFTVIFLGGSRLRKDKKRIEHLFSEIKNCTLCITDFLYPIPESILKKSDVCISSAGSARVSAKLGIPTISIDCEDYKPIGVVNYTTKNTVKRDNEKIRSLSDWLREILIEKKYKKHWIPPKNVEPDFSNHLDVLSPKECQYFDVYNIKSQSKVVYKAWILWFLGLLKCRKFIFKIRSLVHND